MYIFTTYFYDYENYDKNTTKKIRSPAVSIFYSYILIKYKHNIHIFSDKYFASDYEVKTNVYSPYCETRRVGRDRFPPRKPRHSRTALRRHTEGQFCHTRIWYTVLFRMYIIQKYAWQTSFRRKMGFTNKYKCLCR